MKILCGGDFKFYMVLPKVDKNGPEWNGDSLFRCWLGVIFDCRQESRAAVLHHNVVSGRHIQ